MAAKSPISKPRSLSAKTAIRFFAAFFCVLVVGFFFGTSSILAQIQDLYNDKTSEVAGVNALMSAVTSNDVDGVRFFSKSNVELVNQKNYGGATALHIACRIKNFEIVKILLDSGANANLADNEGWTPLMRASLAGDAKIVELLLSRGAKPDGLNSVNESVIIHAANSDCNDCLNLIFKKFDFAQAMDLKILRDQLSEAFSIARNHENQAGQKILEAYLDRATKSLQVAEADVAKAAATKAQTDVSSASDSSQKISTLVIPLSRNSSESAVSYKIGKSVAAAPANTSQAASSTKTVYSFVKKIDATSTAASSQTTYSGAGPRVFTSGNVVFKFNQGEGKKLLPKSLPKK